MGRPRNRRLLLQSEDYGQVILGSRRRKTKDRTPTIFDALTVLEELDRSPRLPIMTDTCRRV